ncbi:hypothetical protein MPTK1_6g08285 [Marchantia polymorpha subsp. ruderalis]
MRDKETLLHRSDDECGREGERLLRVLESVVGDLKCYELLLKLVLMAFLRPMSHFSALIASAWYQAQSSRR